jgi:cytoskeletal protein RodZ
MTARQQIRVGRRIGRDRAPVDASSAPSVGDILHAAREKKGVDLYRAERDTKIRARHLAALESGDYAALPGSVYVKGFLRNYASYLGLDPIEVLDRWHEEQEPVHRTPTAAVQAPPQPLTDPRSGFTLTPGVLVAAFLAIIIVAFVGYVGLQLARFSQMPVLALDGPSVINATPDQRSVTVTGTAPARATVDAFDATQQPAGTTVADDQGHWALTLNIQKGRNDFQLHTRDPETGRDADPRSLVVEVRLGASPGPAATPAPTPFEGIIGAAITPTPSIATDPSQAASAAPASVGPATLDVTSPRQGFTSRDATVTVKGHTDAASVRIAARWVGSGKRPGNPGTTEVAVKGGDFDHQLVLAPGRWDVVVATTTGNGLTSTEARTRIRVQYDGFVVVVGARDKPRVWIQIWADGVPMTSGGIFRNGDTTVIQATDNVTFRTGNERQTVVGVQGDAPTQLTTRAGAGTWSVQKDGEPVRIR